MSDQATGIDPGATIGFVGLGKMGAPMARRLASAGYAVQVHDADADAVAAAESHGCVAAGSAAETARNAAVVVLMLPTSDVVEEVVHTEGLLRAMDAGTVLLDMGSSDPRRTRELATVAAGRGVTVVDAPVSGGVRGAVAGTLAIMVGAEPDDFVRLDPLFANLGSHVLHCGPVGAGDAVKALNNLLSATHLLATAEAMETARRFGLDPATVIAAFNGSSGRSGSTEVKWPKFILPGSYDSGFALSLMVKDMGIALDLARSVGGPHDLTARSTELWRAAAGDLQPDADHTEIARWVEPSVTSKEAPVHVPHG